MQSGPGSGGVGRLPHWHGSQTGFRPWDGTARSCPSSTSGGIAPLGCLGGKPAGSGPGLSHGSATRPTPCPCSLSGFLSPAIASYRLQSLPIAGNRFLGGAAAGEWHSASLSSPHALPAAQPPLTCSAGDDPGRGCAGEEEEEVLIQDPSWERRGCGAAASHLTTATVTCGQPCEGPCSGLWRDPGSQLGAGSPSAQPRSPQPSLQSSPADAFAQDQMFGASHSPQSPLPPPKAFPGTWSP